MQDKTRQPDQGEMNSKLAHQLNITVIGRVYLRAIPVSLCVFFLFMTEGYFCLIQLVNIDTPLYYKGEAVLAGLRPRYVLVCERERGYNSNGLGVLKALSFNQKIPQCLTEIEIQHTAEKCRKM